MSNRMIFLFITSVILASFGIMAIPVASALNQNFVDNSHVTARFEGEHKVCGNHICKPGEKTNWENAVWGHQNMYHHGSEKLTTHSTMPMTGGNKNAHMIGSQ